MPITGHRLYCNFIHEAIVCVSALKVHTYIVYIVVLCYGWVTQPDWCCIGNYWPRSMSVFVGLFYYCVLCMANCVTEYDM